MIPTVLQSELLSEDESSAYAESAYRSKSHDSCLDERSIENSMTKRAYRNHPLSEKDKQFNRLHSAVRCTVESVFGVLKQHDGMAKARTLAWVVTALDLS